MYTAISWIIMVICVFLIIVVLVQNSKGGGLQQNFAGTQQIMGVRKTTDFLEKATWTLAVAVMLLSFVSVAIIPERNNGVSETGSQLEELLQNQKQNAPAAAPSFATPTENEAPAAETEAPAAE